MSLNWAHRGAQERARHSWAKEDAGSSRDSARGGRDCAYTAAPAMAGGRDVMGGESSRYEHRPPKIAANAEAAGMPIYGGGQVASSSGAASDVGSRRREAERVPAAPPGVMPTASWTVTSRRVLRASSQANAGSR